MFDTQLLHEVIGAVAITVGLLCWLRLAYKLAGGR